MGGDNEVLFLAQMPVKVVPVNTGSGAACWLHRLLAFFGCKTVCPRNLTYPSSVLASFLRS